METLQNRKRGSQRTLSHLPSLCWVQTALLETHLQNHNLQKRGTKLKIRNTGSGRRAGAMGGRHGEKTREGERTFYMSSNNLRGTDQEPSCLTRQWPRSLNQRQNLWRSFIQTQKLVWQRKTWVPSSLTSLSATRLPSLCAPQGNEVLLYGSTANQSLNG
jgi:hypothetical protein